MSPYEQYMETAVLTATPIELVRILYRCAIDSVEEARSCLQNGDIVGRAKPVSKALDALTELLLSLDHEAGGQVAANLGRLYGYMQNRVLDGHCQQTEEPLAEVSGLLNTLLGSWEQIEARAEDEAASYPAEQQREAGRYSFTG